MAVVPNVAPVRQAALRYFGSRETAAGVQVERFVGDGSEFDALREHAAARGRVTVEYVMMAGVNVGEEDAAALGRLLAGLPVRLNPIAVNDAGGAFRPPSEAEWTAFRDALARHLPGQPVVRRYSGGQDQHAACGMLASRLG